jgi:hypothetical protein
MEDFDVVSLICSYLVVALAVFLIFVVVIRSF